MMYNEAGERLHLCFDHAFVYNPMDTLMCPQCERDIAEQHDPLFKESYNDNESSNYCGNQCLG